MFSTSHTPLSAPHPMKLADLITRDRVRMPDRVAALDGLRAIAVVAVVVYHLDLSIGGVRLARGGFVGVDLFFVLSGYLIGGLVLKEVHQSGRVNLLAFWGRRARRLLPASATMMAFVVVWAAVVGWGRDVSADVVASALWFQNWQLIASGQGYIDQFLAASPLRHFWSLSIEEQWYFVFPVAALLGRRWLRGRPLMCASILGVAALCSAVTMGLLHSPNTSSWRAYYGTDTRVFALLIGCAASFVPLTRNAMSSPCDRRRWTGLMLVGVALFLVGAFTVSEQGTYMYRGGFVAVALVSLAAVVGAARSRSRWFDTAIVQWLGTRSYGIYLWHWPLIVALSPDRIGVDGLPLAALRCAVTAVVVEISYRWIEQPVRHLRGRSAAPILVLPAGILICLALVLASSVAPERFRAGSSADVLTEAQQNSSVSSVVPPGDLSALVVGDSVAFGLGFLPNDGPGSELVDAISLSNGALPGCGLTHFERPDSTYLVGDKLKDCLAIPDAWRRALATGPDVVVWVVGPYDSVEILNQGAVLAVGTDAWRSSITRRLGEAFEVLTSTDAPLVIVVPPCRQDAPGRVGGLTNQGITDLTEAVIQQAQGYGSRIVITDPSSWVCSAEGTRIDAPSGEPILDDGLHYTAAGKVMFWRWLVPQLGSLVTGP